MPTFKPGIRLSEPSLFYKRRSGPLAGSLAFLMGSLALGACAQGAPPQQTPQVVLAATAIAADGSQTMLSGRVRSSALHEVSVENGGLVTRLLANVGDRVVAGQILAVLDPEPAELQSSQASAQVSGLQVSLENVRLQAARAEQLAEVGASSTQQLEQARSAVLAAEAELRAAQARARLASRAVRQTVIRAPVAGIVTSRAAALSALANPGTVMFTIDGGGPKEIDVHLPATLTSGLQSGQTATFRFGPDQGTARVLAIASSVSGVNARAARLQVLSGDAPHGATVDVRITQQDGEAGVSVPLSAIRTLRDGRQQLMVIDPAGRVSTVNVRLVRVTSGGALVSGALTPGQRVIAAGTELVRPGQTVRSIPFTS